MTTRPLAVLAALLALLAPGSAALAAAKAAPKPAAGKPAASAPKKAPEPAAPATPSGPFDARNPADLIALLASMGAQGQVTNRQDDVVALKFSNPAYSFSVQFAGCDAQGRACKALAFSGVSDARTATVAQINGFNQTSINCHAFQDNAGKPHAWYSALVFASTTRDDMVTHIGAWQGCWASFGDFLKNPTAYLAAAP
jgi:hypothetical protein